MEAHEDILECVVIFTLDVLVVHILGYAVVDVKQCNCIVAHNSSDKLAECAVDIHLAGYRDTLSCQTAVHIAGNKAELCLECRPAFSCDSHIFSVSSVLLYPVF